MHAARLIERVCNPADERQLFVELTERGKSLEDRAACLGPAVFGDIGVPLGALAGDVALDVEQRVDASDHLDGRQLKIMVPNRAEVTNRSDSLSECSISADSRKSILAVSHVAEFSHSQGHEAKVPPQKIQPAVAYVSDIW
jgi:DNA-binding MarR family transcriptional regulator